MVGNLVAYMATRCHAELGDLYAAKLMAGSGGPAGWPFVGLGVGWQRYRPLTVALWITLIAAKLVLMAIAAAAGAPAGGGTSSLLLTLGVSVLAEA